MDNHIIINDRIYKPYDQNYYVSADGDVYSKRYGKSLKQNVDLDGYRRVDIHGKHMKVHRLVYSVWVGPIPRGMQVNHRDDIKSHNNVDNLYVGTQKENIQDCIRNKRRSGNEKYLTVRDTVQDEIMTFLPASDFIRYCGHPCGNGSVKRMFSKNWFKSRYEILGYGYFKV